MTDRKSGKFSGQSCQQLRYYQIRGEKWLLKLKLLVLAVLCVLLGAFLIAFKVQKTVRSVQLLQAEKNQLIKDLQEKETIIQQLQTEKNKQTCYPQYECVGDACCAEGWKYFSGKCYYFSTDNKTWTESRDTCVAAGGHLVIISSRNEQEFLKKSEPGFGGESYWVGLTDAVTEGDWRWLDGSRLTRIHWAGNEPDDWKGENYQYPEGEDCALFCLDPYDYGLQDGLCDVQERKEKHICEAKAPK